MKRTIRLTESELRNFIRQAINEEEFDWNAFEDPDRWRQTNRDVKYLKAQMKDNLDIPHDFNPYFHDEYDRDEDNDYSWEQWDNRPIALSPVTDTWSSQEDIPGDIDYAIDKNNERLYGNEAEIDDISKQARDKWINGKSSDYMEGWTDAKMKEAKSRLRDLVKESIKNYLKESWYDKWDERENKLKTIKQIEEQCKVEAIYLPDGTIMFDFQDEYYNHEDFDEWCEIEFYPDIDAEVNAPAYTIVELDYDLTGDPKPTEEQMTQIIKQYQGQIMQDMAETAKKYYGYDLVY
jgi:hypothetical protein